MKSLISLLVIILAVSMILIPTLFVIFYDGDSVFGKDQKKIELDLKQSQNVQVKVYRNQSKKVEIYPLEAYVRGVVAAEMPISFELEALKAQALAARTYIVKKMIDKDYSNVPMEAMVTDTVKDQVFLSDEELQNIWGFNYDDRISKLNRAINETNGQVITYNNVPITSLFFSTSNGYTENSEEYFTKQAPYLRSVDSHWDLQSPKYQASKFISYKEISQKLNIDMAVLTSSDQSWMKTIEMSQGKSIKKIKIGDKVISGREIREKLDLNSASFTWEIKKDGVAFLTNGYGHGVGMSQYGANGMAKEGKSAEVIIKHYYTGVSITNISKWVKPAQ